jgi:Mn2+ and Fe2+ transporters of the NRAMP family
VLAGSAAYAMAEAAGLPSGLGRKPGQARLFYLILIGATLLGALVSFSPIDPIRLLFWSAVLNGVIAVPLMVAVMWLATRRSVMGRFAVTGTLRALGWLATAVMLVVVLAMLL